MNRYRLIYPYDSNNVYVETNVMKAADKCYSEMKKNDKNNPHFCMMNIDTNNIYNFEIPKRSTLQTGGVKESNELDGILGTSIQEGGANTPEKDKKEEKDEDKINTMEKQIEELQIKLHKLKGNSFENKKKDKNSVIKPPSNIYNNATFRLTEMDQLENYEKKDNCVIM